MYGRYQLYLLPDMATLPRRLCSKWGGRCGCYTVALARKWLGKSLGQQNCAPDISRCITQTINAHHHVLNTAELPGGIAQSERRDILQQCFATRILEDCSAFQGCAYTQHSMAAANIDKHTGGLPVFLEPSSSELSTLLAKINAKILLPEHLTREQQKLVYSQSSRSKLETEPVEVTVGDVTLPLEFIDRNRQPNRFDSLKEVITKAETTADQENVVRVLEGFHSAGIAVPSSWQAMVVQNLIKHGHYNIVLKALQRVKATGLRLSNYSVTYKTLKSAHDRAAKSDWAEEETVKALRYARQVVELMEEEEHHAVASRGAKENQTDWRSRPFVVAAPTELAAVIAQKHNGDVEIVKTLAGRLVNALKQDDAATIDRVIQSSSKSDHTFQNKAWQTAALREHCCNLFELLVVWNALKTSSAVLGADMPLAAEAAEYQSRIKQLLDEGFKATAKLQNRDGVELRSAYPAYLSKQLQKCQQ